MLYWTLLAVCGLVLASVADATCNVSGMDTCAKCKGASTDGCKVCAVGTSHFLCADTACPAGLATEPTTCADGKPNAAVVTTSVGCLGNTQKKLCKTTDSTSHICMDIASSTKCDDIVKAKLVDPTCATPESQDKCAKCGTAWCNTCALGTKGFLCTSEASCPVGQPATACKDELKQVTPKPSGACVTNFKACYHYSTAYCIPSADNCVDYGLTNEAHCDVSAQDTCGKCQGAAGCKPCEVTTGYFLCADTKCPTGLDSAPGTCTDLKPKAALVTTALGCLGNDAKRLCKTKDPTSYICMEGPPPPPSCSEIAGEKLVDPTCATPDNQKTCDACGKAWCNTCALGADNNKKGFLCTKEAKCPVGSVAITCTGLDKQVITVADGGKCEATATTCTKANAKYCIVGVTDAKCAEFGLDVSTDEGGNGGGDKDGDCKGQACKACVDNAKCSACIKDTMSVCITKGGACPDIANQTATVGVSCDKVTGTVVEGTCETPNHKCKKGNGDVCIVEECKAAGLDSNAAPPAMATLVGLAIAIVAMHC